MFSNKSRECQWCGKCFIPKSANAKVCSERCRRNQKTFRDKLKQQENTVRRNKAMQEIAKKSTIDETLKDMPEGMNYGEWRAIKSGVVPKVDLSVLEEMK